MSLVWLLGTVLIVHFRVTVWSQDVYCNNAYECNLSSVLLNVSSDTYIICNGYHSCSKASQIGGFGPISIVCAGSFSCYQAQKIQHIDQTLAYADIRCVLFIYPSVL